MLYGGLCDGGVVGLVNCNGCVCVVCADLTERNLGGSHVARICFGILAAAGYC